MSSSVKDFEVPWVEKYRPKTLDDVVGNVHAIESLKTISKSGNIPNFLLSGPPGTGKTSSIHALARAILGDRAKEAVLEMNASDSRGIDVVRNKIKSFAMNKVNLPSCQHKIVILDEADAMTQDAQQALRRTMELHSSTTRFALACNNSSKIITPIQSRCLTLRFGWLSDEEILFRLIQVCGAEKVSYATDGMEAIIFTAEGDMRNALNNLQSTVAGFGHVSMESVYKVCDQPHPSVILKILESCCEGDMLGAQAKMKALYDTGYSAYDIIGNVFRVCKRKLRVDEVLQLEMMREIGYVHMRIANGSSSLLQLVGLCAKLCRVSIQAKNSVDSDRKAFTKQ